MEQIDWEKWRDSGTGRQGEGGTEAMFYFRITYFSVSLIMQTIWLIIWS